MLHFCQNTMLPSTENEGPSGCTTFRGFSPVLQPLSCITTHWLSHPSTASMHHRLSINKEHQSYPLTASMKQRLSINKEHQRYPQTANMKQRLNINK